MNVDEKKIIQTITNAVLIMPDEGRKYILGYAEGVIEMAGALRGAPAQDSA